VKSNRSVAASTDCLLSATDQPGSCAVAIRIPRAVVCLISALAHHGLTTAGSNALISPCQPCSDSRSTASHCGVLVSNPRSVRYRRTTIGRHPSAIYSPEKTVADCFKYRNKIGLDVAVERSGLARPEAEGDFQSLSKFAQSTSVR